MRNVVPQPPSGEPGNPAALLTDTGAPALPPSEPSGGGRGGPLYRGRVLVGLVLALGVSLLLAQGLLTRALESVSIDRADRQTFVSLRALEDMVQRAGGTGDAVRAVVSTWKEQMPPGSAVRVIAFSGIRLEASTFPEDVGERAAPRRLSREEKPLYDRGQRLRASVDTNREESTARKVEVEAESLPGGGRLLSAPVEVEGAVVGMVEMATAPLAAPLAPSLGSLALWWLLPLALCTAAAFVVRRQGLLVAVSVVALLVGLGGYASYSLSTLGAEVRGTQTLVAERLQSMSQRAQAVMAERQLSAEPPLRPGDWDSDAFRRPLGLVTPEGQVNEAVVSSRLLELRSGVGRALGGLGVLSLAVLLFIGMGGVHRTAATIVENRTAYAYIAPAMVGMLVLVFFPFFYGIALSFTDSTLYNVGQPLSSLWVGVRNYVEILGDFNIARRAQDGSLVFNYLNFYYTLFFTVVWTVTNVVLGVSVGLGLALILNVDKLAMRPAYRVLLILPWAMPNYITALIWKGLFHQQFGVVNHLIRMFGGQGLSWYDTPFTAFLTVLTTNGWLSFPFMMVVSLGALQSIPMELYEAARVDGASRWQQFKAITLPSLKPALVPAIILSVVWTFNQFNVIFLVTEGEPSNSTEILITQAYRYAFQRYRYGYAAAYSTVIFGILLLYSLVQNRVSRATEAA
ncbi:carbohydrate ABC transporter permease [Melittangium boletus]|uniref:Maltose/maltodextrin ABC transporter permease MalF n=1 Tax=Melittangium boletus DSM 14713 TaxID=1294270 RepID=A0A250IAT9_9BACT|nr:sugar ABC transporter permease [Melittangium boletus]ATB28984.1 Maltose/maltodextrin ABC transporter permease MalF [Melittangium boletus DSM 14713]